jgi:hypothetical protein
MFKKFFGKKNDGFYMQVDESVAPTITPSKAAEPKEVAPQAKVVAPKAEPATESASQPEVTTATVVADPTTEQTEQKTKSAKTSIKKNKKEDQKGKDKKEDKAAVQPEITTATPVAAAFSNFATDYLITPAVAGNRRRPGANMKGFMSMARDVKEMKKGSTGSQLKEKAAKKTEA